MVVYPFEVNDQKGTAGRLVYHRIGVRGIREKDSPAEIRSHVERAMNDRVLRENIGLMKKQIETYRENNVVADAVRRVIESAAK
jgi:UDP:flavonoid glycosyltransferase YjiC (YdhE family)